MGHPRDLPLNLAKAKPATRDGHRSQMLKGQG